MEESISKKNGAQLGSPIYRIIDKLMKDNKYFKLVLTSKGGFTKLNLRKIRDNFTDFKLSITVLADKANVRNKSTLIKNIYREIAHSFYIVLRFFI